MEPFFSVIVPTFNRADCIAKALNSVLTQAFTNFEIIVVDDGSTDDTEAVVATIVDQRLRYFKKENEERSIARNYGIKKAIGQYINFLDSDDFQLPNHLEVAFSVLKKNNFPEVLHLGHQLEDQQGETLLKRNDLSTHSLLNRMVHENVLHGNAIFIQKSVALKNQFINSPLAFISEDWVVWMKLLVRYKVLIDNTITSVVVEHDQRSLKTVDAEKLVACTELIVKHLKEDKKFVSVLGYKANIYFSNQYTFLALILALSGDKKNETWEYLFRALQQDITVLARKRFLASLKHLTKSYFLGF